ncbi:MAG TPA: ABC transporter permease [Methylomirabilota bacterium]|nr:ABC transporter permease [Methylomirabilota bacterium]
MDSLRRCLAIARKEAREIRRDPITLGIAMVLPLIMMFLLAYAITLDVREIRMAVLDEDGSADSREYVAGFLRSGYFRLQATVHSFGEVERLLDYGAARLVLVIPEGFARTLAQGRPVDVQILLDGSFANTAILALNYADRITEDYTLGIQERSLASRAGSAVRLAEAVRLEPRIRHNLELRNENFVVPGLFALILMAFPPMLTALAVVRERQRGSILQLAIAPVRPWEFLVGKLVPYAALAFAEMLLLLAAGWVWFGVAVRGSVPLLLGLSLIYVLCTVAIGLAVSTVTRSQVVAILLSIVLTLMPSFLFSGFLFSIDSMPVGFRAYTYLFPARYFMTIARGIVLKGAGLDQLWGQALALVAYGAVLLTLASLRFGRRLG